MWGGDVVADYLGSRVCGLGGAVTSLRATDPSENDAEQQAADLNVTLKQGQPARSWLSLRTPSGESDRDPSSLPVVAVASPGLRRA